jgi:hypothetical protein
VNWNATAAFPSSSTEGDVVGYYLTGAFVSNWDYGQSASLKNLITGGSSAISVTYNGTVKAYTNSDVEITSGVTHVGVGSEYILITNVQIKDKINNTTKTISIKLNGMTISAS